MAIIGAKYVVYAPITERKYGVRPTYGTGKVLAKLTKVDVNITNTNTKLYADDATAEVDHSFTSGTVAVGLDDLTNEAQKGILGNKEETEDTVKVLTKAANDEPPHVGLGYMRSRKRNGVKSWEANIFLDVMFQEPNTSSNTKGENIEFQTPELTADIMTCEGYNGGAYQEIAEFSTENAAKAWIDTKLNVSEVSAASYTPYALTTSEDDE